MGCNVLEELLLWYYGKYLQIVEKNIACFYRLLLKVKD